MRCHVMIGTNTMLQKLRKKISARLQKRYKKGELQYQVQEQDTNSYYLIWGNDRFCRKLHDDLQEYLRKTTDDNLISRAAAKINTRLSEAHKQRVKSFMGGLFDIQVWLTDDNNNPLEIAE